MASLTKHQRATLALICTQILFGVNYLVAKEVVMALPPLLWAFVRVVLTAGLLGLVALRTPSPKLSNKFISTCFFLSLLGVAINQSAFLVGLHYSTPTNSAILNTLIPVFAILFVVILGKEKMDGRKMLGFLSALLGALIVLRVEEFQVQSSLAMGDLLMVVNSLSYGLFLALAKPFLEKHDRVWVTFWLFTFGSVSLAIPSLQDFQSSALPSFTPELWFAMAFVVVMGTFVPYLLNNWALAHTNTSQVALYTYLQPVVVTLLMWATKGEHLSARAALGSGFIFVGAYLSTTRTSLSR